MIILHSSNLAIYNLTFLFAAFEENYVIDEEDGGEEAVAACCVPAVSRFDLNKGESSIAISLLPAVQQLYDKSLQKAE